MYVTYGWSTNKWKKYIYKWKWTNISFTKIDFFSHHRYLYSHSWTSSKESIQGHKFNKTPSVIKLLSQLQAQTLNKQTGKPLPHVLSGRQPVSKKRPFRLPTVLRPHSSTQRQAVAETQLILTGVTAERGEEKLRAESYLKPGHQAENEVGCQSDVTQ